MISLNETAAAVAALLRHNYNRVGSCFEQVRSTGIAVKIIYTAEIALLSHSNKETLGKKKNRTVKPLLVAGDPPCQSSFFALVQLAGRANWPETGGRQSTAMQHIDVDAWVPGNTVSMSMGNARDTLAFEQNRIVNL